MTPEQFIERNIRKHIPDISQSALDAAMQHYRTSKYKSKGIYDDCLAVAKQHMIKVKK